ncbi:MAG: GNAT family N-acetyltransferase [Bryobacteraceae bacterium]|nr:GNAT family N-acetyltransferase [Bryobacteraceae bacterium]
MFEDMDNQDFHAFHLLGTADGIVLACARLFAPGDYYEQAAIGRVVTAAACRGQGVGRELMRQAIAAVERRWGLVPIRIGAQAYLEAFYGSFGFVRDGDNYLEDGIPHLHMLRSASPPSSAGSSSAASPSPSLVTPSPRPGE